jgi:hypothetical protein
MGPVRRSLSPTPAVRGLPKGDSVLKIKGHRWAGPVAVPYTSRLPNSFNTINEYVDHLVGLAHTVDLCPVL